MDKPILKRRVRQGRRQCARALPLRKRERQLEPEPTAVGTETLDKKRDEKTKKKRKRKNPVEGAQNRRTRGVVRASEAFRDASLV